MPETKRTAAALVSRCDRVGRGEEGRPEFQMRWDE